MNYLKPQTPAFNWDDINVGDHHLDHSEHFFQLKHTTHERLDELNDINQQMASAGIDDVLADDHDKENEKPLNTNTSPSPLKLKPEDAVEENATCPTPKTEAPEPSTALDETAAPTIKAAPNLLCQWSTQKVHKTKLTAKQPNGKPTAMAPPPAPHAYKFKDVYQQKKEDALRKRADEERKKREFHSKPAPNFSAHHQKLEQRQVIHKVTVAVTPQVLKKSREADEKRRKRLEEWKRRNPPPKFESRAPDVLKEEPFVPKKAPTVLEQRPFTLHSEQRAIQRKVFNQEAHQALEKKRKQVEIEEEEKKKREEERIKELRKMATFKARPNPFK